MLSHFPPKTSERNFDLRCSLIPDNSPYPQLLEQELESLHSAQAQSSNDRYVMKNDNFILVILSIFANNISPILNKKMKTHSDRLHLLYMSSFS